MAYERNLDNMTLDGGWLCLDFVNTVHDRSVADRHDYLKSCEDLFRWGIKTRILDDRRATALHDLSKKDTTKAEKAFHKAKEVREILYQLFRPIATRQVPARTVVAAFNKVLSPALSGLSIQIDGPDAAHLQQKNPVHLENPLHQVIKSAYDLLLSANLNRVKECGSCGWLFLDKSKNNSRRWCNMQNCGSAVKAKRYYRKKKLEGI